MHSAIRSKFGGGIAIAFVVVSAVTLALSIVVGMWPVGTALVGFGFWSVMFARLTQQNRSNRDLIFWLLLILVFTVGFVQKRTGTSLSILLELVMLLGMPFTVWSLGRMDARLKRLFLLILFFLIISILSAFFGRSQLFAAAFQFATDLKFVILLLIGFYITWSEKTEYRFWLIMRWLWLPLMLLVAWQWFSPGTYFKYIHLTYSGQADPLGLVPSRALGPYNHSATFAAVLSLLFLISVSRALTKQKSYFLVAGAYFLLLFGTTQRLEILSLLAIISVLYIYYSFKGRGSSVFLKGLFSIFVVAGLVLAALPMMKERLNRDSEFREFTGEVKPFRPRPVYYATSFSIANDFIPLGSGPGTFAGAGASKFNWNYYQQLGFFSYPWFNPTFLFETYWPHFIAEGGWFGFLAYFLFVVGLVRYSFQSFRAATDTTERMYWLIATTGLMYLLLTSFNGPTFEDPETAFLAVPFVGIAHRFTRERLSRSVPAGG